MDEEIYQLQEKLTLLENHLNDKIYSLEQELNELKEKLYNVKKDNNHLETKLHYVERKTDETQHRLENLKAGFKHW